MLRHTRGAAALPRGAARRVWCCSPSRARAILVTRYLEAVVAVPAPVHAAATRPAHAPGAAARRDGQPAGRPAPPRRVLGRLLAGQHAVLPGRPGPAGVAGRRRDQRGPPHAAATASASSTSTIMVENVAAGLIDLAARLDRPPELSDTLIGGGPRRSERATSSCGSCCTPSRCSPSPTGTGSRDASAGSTTSASPSTRCRLQPVGAGTDQLRLKVAVADRRYHATQLRDLTGLDVGEGQATHPARRPARLPGAAVPGSRPRRRRADGGPAVGHGGRQRRPCTGRTRRSGYRHSHPGVLRPARGAVAAQRARPATTSAPTGRWRRCPATSYPPTPRPRWPS